MKQQRKTYNETKEEKKKRLLDYQREYQRERRKNIKNRKYTKVEQEEYKEKIALYVERYTLLNDKSIGDIVAYNHIKEDEECSCEGLLDIKYFNLMMYIKNKRKENE